MASDRRTDPRIRSWADLAKRSRRTRNRSFLSNPIPTKSCQRYRPNHLQSHRHRAILMVMHQAAMLDPLVEAWDERPAL